LGTLARLHELRVETVVLSAIVRTYFRMRLSEVEYGMLIVGLLFINYRKWEGGMGGRAGGEVGIRRKGTCLQGDRKGDTIRLASR
jgi:hypothetical protein